MNSQPTSVESIFLEVLEKPTLRERAAYLDEVCACDPSLRQRVETLLRAQEDAGSFLEVPLVGGAKPAATVLQGSVESPLAGQTPTAGTGPSSVDRSALDFLGAPKHPGQIGTLGPYEITEVVGRGGMGIVLKGFDPRLHRFVAVKVLAPEAASNPMARQRFLREAQAAAAISHDHVVTIYAVDESDRLPYLVMEYINGVSLQDLLNRKGGLETGGRPCSGPGPPGHQAGQHPARKRRAASQDH
jgi:Protein kinase domain